MILGVSAAASASAHANKVATGVEMYVEFRFGSFLRC